MYIEIELIGEISDAWIDQMLDGKQHPTSYLHTATLEYLMNTLNSSLEYDDFGLYVKRIKYAADVWSKVSGVHEKIIDI